MGVCLDGLAHTETRLDSFELVVAPITSGVGRARSLDVFERTIALPLAWAPLHLLLRAKHHEAGAT